MNQLDSQRAATFTWLIFFALAFAVSCSRPAERRLTQVRQPTTLAGRQTLTGRVVSVADGDTIMLLDSADSQHRIRLEGIDAPELHQAFGNQSKQSLSEMIFEKDVMVSYQKIDQYGRIVGKVMLDGKDINLEQVKAGMAWHYKFYEHEQTADDRDAYAKAEDEARVARRGLWQDPNPVEPSEFRREENRAR